MEKILVITSEPDPHVEMVKKKLPTNIQMEIFDPKKIALSGSFTISDDGALSSLAGINPVSIWYRKPKFLSDSDLRALAIPSDYISAIASLNEEGFSIINETYPDCFWVSHPSSIKKASNKLLQLLIAKENGFSIPETIFSSDFEAIEKLRQKVGDIVMKPLGRPYARVDGTPSWFFATVIPKEKVMEYDGLGVTPMIFQELIHKDFDLRVTVIGDQVFACKIVSKQMDWRTEQSDQETLFEPFRLEQEIVNKCLSMNKRLDLNFGAYDFAFSNDGTLIFLEVNPNGQWGFVEERTGLPLSETMAKLLSRSL